MDENVLIECVSQALPQPNDICFLHRRPPKKGTVSLCLDNALGCSEGEIPRPGFLKLWRRHQRVGGASVPESGQQLLAALEGGEWWGR